MRLVAGSLWANKIRAVWHCEECRKLLCSWVDDEAMQYGEYVNHGFFVVKQAKKIVITKTMVYINPTDGPDDETENEDELTLETT